PGEGAVVIRYQGLVATARVILPFGPPRRAASEVAAAAGSGSPPTPAPGTRGTSDGYQPAARVAGQPAPSPIDPLVQAKLDALGLEPSVRCTDEEFVRRAYLDAVGLLPGPDEVRAFLWSRDPRK